MADHDKKSKAGKVVVAAMFGGFAGAMLGLLLAPKSGRELRQDLIVKAHKLGDEAAVIGDKAQKVWQEIEEKAGEKAEALQTTGKDWIEEGKRLISDLKTLVYEIRHGSLTKTKSIEAADVRDSDDSTEEM